MNKVKLGLVFIFSLTGIVGFTYLSDSPMVVRVLSVLVGLLLAAFIARHTTQGDNFFAFCKESSAETKKVVWPNRKETLQTSAMVFAFVVTMALFLWLVDAALMGIIRLLMNQGV